MLKYIVLMAALNACVFAMEAEARSPNHSGLTIHQIYGGDNGSAVRIYRTPTDGTAPSMEMYYDHRSSAVPSLPQYDELPGTRYNRHLLERTLEQSGYYDDEY